MASRTMMPCDVVIAQAENSVWPTKDRLSNTFTGSAYHVSRAGGAGGPPARPCPRPGPPPRGAGGLARAVAPLHSGVNRPSWSVPAAAFAASMCFCASAGIVCAPGPAAKSAHTNAATVPARCLFTATLLSLRLVHVRALPEEDFGALHQRFRQRRVRMDHELHVFRRRTHFDGQRTLGDQLARARTGDA